MARLESQKKMGYYPTPDKVLPLIKSMIQTKGDPARYHVLDPCCGKGEFVRAMPDGCMTYGIELDPNRFLEAKEIVNKILHADTLYEIAVSHEAFSCLYLNPPYDYTETASGKTIRLELLFLKKTTPYLQESGVLVFIVPCETLRSCAEFLSNHYKNIQVFKFPYPEYHAFKQVVLFGVKGEGEDYESYKKLRDIGYNTFGLKHLENCHLLQKYVLPATKNPPTLFYSIRINPDHLSGIVKQQGKLLETLCEFENIGTINTIIPLRKGHMAMLLASGMIDGEFKNDDQWLLVKGTTKKSVIVVEDEDSRIEKDKIDIVLTAVDLHTGSFLDIK